MVLLTLYGNDKQVLNKRNFFQTLVIIIITVLYTRHLARKILPLYTVGATLNQPLSSFLIILLRHYLHKPTTQLNLAELCFLPPQGGSTAGLRTTLWDAT